MPDRIAHLEMIQGIVNRLSNNSFLLKGWSVLLVSAFFALAAKDAKIRFIYLAYFPAVVLWALDGYFLRQEKLFRAIYDQVRIEISEEVDFSMDTKKVSAQVDSWGAVVTSKTLLGFHGVIVVTIFLVGVFS